jgi:hypothetical protein
MFSTPIQLISVEPSPKVFCEMDDFVTTKLVEEDRKNNVRLNVALSDQTGHLIFKDPGHEDGKIIRSNFTDLSKMAPNEYQQFSQCKLADFKNMSLDDKRQSIVPTYTLDLLVSSLEDPAMGKINQNEEIFVIKIDTEGKQHSKRSAQTKFKYSGGFILLSLAYYSHHRP